MPPKTQALPSIEDRAAGVSRGTARRLERLQSHTLARRILGIDPGLQRTGYGLIEFDGVPRLVDAGILTAKPSDDLPTRLQSLYDALGEVLREHSPDAVVIEELFSTYAHPRSALLMAHARGVLMLAAQQSAIPVHSFLPNEVKQVLTGNGHATKGAVQAAVKSRLKLAEAPEPPDVADALAIAICFATRQEAAFKIERGTTKN